MSAIDVTSLSVGEIAQRSVRMRGDDHPEGARDFLIAALRLHPGEAILWQSLGLAHRAMLDSAPALEALERAAELAPTDGKIAHALAHVSWEAGIPAVGLFDRALALRPDDPAVRIGRAAAQFAAGAADMAIAGLEEACRRSPLWLEGQGLLADLKWQCGHGAAFTDGYREALAAHPRSSALWLALLDRLLRVERYDWALAALIEARGALGEASELAPIQAICASELGDSEQADRLFAALFSQAHYLKSADVLARGARHLLRTGRIAAAASLLETGVTGPEAGKLWPYLATTWRLLGDARWQWLEGDERLVRRVKIYEPGELPAVRECLRGLHQAVHEPLGQSVRRGSQTDGQLFARTEAPIQDLRRRIEQAVREHIAILGPIDPAHPTLGHRPRHVRFAGSWSVRLCEAGHHSNHIHPQGWLSSALSIAMPPPEECGAPPAGYLQFGLPPHELGLALEPVRQIAPEPGWLTLFPSTMWHGTAPISGGERLSVAFDVKP